MKKLIPAIAIAMMVPSLWAVKGTVASDKDSKTGDVKYDLRAKEYVVSYKNGATQVEARFPVKKVVELKIDKPAGYDKLAQLVDSGDGSKAVEGLKKIVAEYANLEWDKPAARYLTKALLDGNKLKDALETAQKVVDGDKTAAYKGDLAPEYWRALMLNGRKDELGKYLDRAATSGDRASAAAALVMRGDVLLDSGNETAELLRQAIVENYLKVALMYTDPPCVRARKSAMLKAAECMKKLGMATRAETLAKQAEEL